MLVIADFFIISVISLYNQLSDSHVSDGTSTHLVTVYAFWQGIGRRSTEELFIISFIIH